MALESIYSASHSTINEIPPQETADNGITEEKKEDPFLVRFTDGDPENPKNWSDLKRWYLTMTGGLLVLNATFASSSPSGIAPQLMESFHMSLELATLCISLFVAGYCVGPLLWGPLSEQYGRRPIFILAFFVYTVFQMACALSTSTAQILVFRFLGGVFAAAPLTNSGALIADIWDARTRGKALSIFTLAPFAGPAIGPTVAGFIVVGGASWRWLFWVLTMFAGVCWLQIIFTLPETYAPIILVAKAKRMRKESGDERFYAPMERLPPVSFGKRVNNIVALPFKILFAEPMLIALTTYMSFVYGCMYLLFEAYPIVFGEMHGFNAGISGLMFLPLPLGGLVAVLIYLFYYNPRYEEAMLKHAPNPVPPEFRLEIAVIAAPLFTISFFWSAWTSYASISFWAPMMAGSLLGFAICWIFLALTNYAIDAYLFVAASALAALTVFRSLAGAAFPLFATQMYDALNPRWAGTLLGCLALLMTPIPIILIKFGPRLRAKSKYAPSLPPPVVVLPKVVEV